VYTSRLTAAGRSIRPLAAASYARDSVFLRERVRVVLRPPPPPQGLCARPATWRLPRAARPATGAASRRRHHHRLPPRPVHYTDNRSAINSVAAAALKAKLLHYNIIIHVTRWRGRMFGARVGGDGILLLLLLHTRRARVGGGWLVRRFVPRSSRIDVDAARLEVPSFPSACAHEYDYYYASVG